MTTPKPVAATPVTPVAPKTAEERIEAIEGVVFELIDRVEKLTKSTDDFKKQAVTKPKGLFGGKRTPSPMKDLKTGKVYPSKAAVGKNFATEAGGDPLNTMVYYTVMKVLKMPDGTDRFVEATEEEGIAARAEYQAQIEKEVAEANARLAADEEAKAKAEKEAATKAPVNAPAKIAHPAKK